MIPSGERNMILDREGSPKGRLSAQVRLGLVYGRHPRALHQIDGREAIIPVVVTFA